MSNLNKNAASSQDTEQEAPEQEQESIEQDRSDDELDQDMMVYPELKDRVLSARPIISYKTDIKLIDVLSIFPYDIAQALLYWQESFENYKQACLNRQGYLCYRDLGKTPERIKQSLDKYCRAVWASLIAHGNALTYIEHALERYEAVNKDYDAIKQAQATTELTLAAYYDKSLHSVLLEQFPKVDFAEFTQVPPLVPTYTWLESFYQLLCAFRNKVRNEWQEAVKLCMEAGEELNEMVWCYEQRATCLDVIS